MDLKDKNKTTKNKTFIESFKHALYGIKTVMTEERNMKYHVSFSALVIMFGVLFHLDKMEWLFLLFTIFLVLVTETINTCFENLVDLVTNHAYHDLAKKVKDMAAGAVLLTALLACLVGAIIFLPKIWQLII
ncbi:MAG: diacylglycerol kinase family protein [Vagococcus sp.]|uniref:diacylglycerol kinase family protein n=1 Tax=Vagococcus sp. TaxID=1933889 RepID=UPI002FC83235